MSFIMGSSCFLHSPIPTSPSSSSSSPHTIYWFPSSRRNAQPNKTKYRGSSIVCLNYNEGDRNGGVGKRREILFLGVSILPLLGLKARALEDLVTGAQADASPNPFLSLANGIGIVSSGVIGAFYVLTRQEKKDAEASFEFKSLDDAKKNGEVLTNELRVVNELLKKTKGELQTASQELAAKRILKKLRNPSTK